MDNFSNFPTTPISPARSAIAVIPGDDIDLPNVTRAIYIGQAGDVSVHMADGDQVVFRGLPAGSLLPIRVIRVTGTSTTAGSIIALW